MVARPYENDRVRRDVEDDRADLREAYERGRRDAQAARKRHPILMTFMFIAAVIGVILLALAAMNGSFGGAGQMVDQNLSVAADKAEPAVRGAANDAGRAINDATDGNDATQPGR